MHFRNGEQVVFTVWGVCAKYPICDFFVTIHVTLTVLVLSSLKTGKKLERYSRSYHAFGMAKLFWVCVRVYNRRGHQNSGHKTDTCFTQQV
jgi:hypothetical protein